MNGIPIENAVLIDEIERNGKKHYLFCEELNDDNFSFKGLWMQEDKRVLETIDEIEKTRVEEEFEFISVPDEIKEFIKKEQRQNFREINNLLVRKMDIDKVDELIKNVNIYGIKSRGISFYDRAENLIAYQIGVLKGYSEHNRNIRLHEFIHLIQANFDDFNIRCLDEPQVESLANQITVKSSNEYVLTNNYTESLLINYKCKLVSGYISSVNFLKQMEMALGREFYKEDFLNRESFYRDFASKYGYTLLTYMMGRMYRIENEKFDSLEEKNKYIQDTQDNLFREVFDKDMESIKTMEEAKLFLKKMRNMVNIRAKSYCIVNGKFIDLNKGEELYNKYYRRLGNLLHDYGYPKDVIIKELEKEQYERTHTDEEIKEIEHLKKTIIPTNISRYKEYYKKTYSEKIEDDAIKVYFMIGKYDEIWFKIGDNMHENRYSYKCYHSIVSNYRKENKVDDEYSPDCLIENNFKILENEGIKFEEIDLSKYREVELERG